MAQTVIAGSVAKDSSPGAYILGGPVDPATGDVRPQRGRNISGGLSSGEVILYGPDGNPLLPAAAALADGAALPTTTQVGAVLYGYDGTVLRFVRTVGAPGASAGTGLLAAGVYLHDGSATYYRWLASNGPGDANSGPGIGTVAGWSFNETSFDRQRGNTQGTLLASAARTATTNSPDQTNWNFRGVEIVIDVTATPNNAETLTVVLQSKDSITGKYVTRTAFAVLTASVLGAAPTTATYVYQVYPGAVLTSAVAQTAVQGVAVPRIWRAQIVHSAAGSWTYSVSVNAIL